MKQKGFQFNSETDTEVIAEGFSAFGTSFIERFNGMFAIAIYDKLNDSLHLVRDRMGIKPLYFYYKENQLVFASEIKSK